jgi:sec-independent protein translocase protein TatA
MNPFLIAGLSATELIIVLMIVLVIFGAGKLPQIGDALGRSIRNFKKSANGNEDVDVTPGSDKALPDASAKTPVVDAEEINRARKS